MPKSICCAVLLALALAAGATLGAEPPSLKAHMDAATFSAAGLDQLSPEQLRTLEGWLAGHAGELAREAAPDSASARTAAAGLGTAPPTAKPHTAATPASHAATRDAITSRVAGPFSGWQPGQSIRLENGQRWRIVDASQLVPGRTIDAAVVTIKPGFAGSWWLKVEGFNTRARVEPAN